MEQTNNSFGLFTKGNTWNESLSRFKCNYRLISIESQPKKIVVVVVIGVVVVHVVVVIPVVDTRNIRLKFG